MAWFKRSEKNIKDNDIKEMPEGLWTKSPTGEIIYKSQLEENMFTDPNSTHHFRIGSKEYIKILFDKNTFTETNKNVKSGDPLEFIDTKKYKDRLKVAYSTSELSDALTTGLGKMGGHEVSFACMNFGFVGGSMGSVVGEKFIRAVNNSIEKKNSFYLYICFWWSKDARGRIIFNANGKNKCSFIKIIIKWFTFYFNFNSSYYWWCKCIICYVRRYYYC